MGATDIYAASRVVVRMMDEAEPVISNQQAVISNGRDGGRPEGGGQAEAGANV